MLAFTALVIGWAVLLLADPAPRLKAVFASLGGSPAQSPADGQGAPRAQSTADAQASLPADNPVQSVQPAAVPDTPEQPQPQMTEQPTEDRSVLIRQFQSWAKQQDSQPEAQSEAAPAGKPPTAKPPVAAARSAPVPGGDVTGAARVVQQKPRPPREPRNARTDLEAARRAQAKAPRAQSVPARPQPAEDARVPDEPAQPPQPPSLLQMFGVRN